MESKMSTHKTITQSSGHSIDNVISMLLLVHATHNIIPDYCTYNTALVC